MLSRSKSGFKIVEVNARSYYASGSGRNNNNNNNRFLNVTAKMMMVSVSMTSINNGSSKSSVHPASLRRRRRTSPTATRWQSKMNLDVTSPRHHRCHRRRPVSMLRRWTPVRTATVASGTASRGIVHRALTGSTNGTGRQAMTVCVSGPEDVQETSSTLDGLVISHTWDTGDCGGATYPPAVEPNSLQYMYQHCDSPRYT